MVKHGVMSGGIPLAGVDFYAELELNNNRDWWTAHKESYDRQVREPLSHLVDHLEAEFGPAKIFRPQRDLRFSHDKSPYKTHQGAVVSFGPALGWYVQVSAEGLMTAGGWYMSSPDQVRRYRDAVASDRSGVALAAVVAALREEGYGIDGDQLKSAPRGYDRDHARMELLRHKSLTASAHHGTPDWLDTPEAVEVVIDDWRAYRPLLEWLRDHVA